MNLNLDGKIDYIQTIIKWYPHWYRVFGSRLAKKPLKRVRLSNGLTIVSGENNLIPDLVDEIFIREVYNPGGMGIKKGDTVVDLGANIGLFSLYATLKGAKKIYAIEPLESNIKAIGKNFEINSYKKPTIIKKALTDKKGETNLYIDNLHSESSTVNKAKKKGSSKKIRVQTDTLENLMEEHSIDKIDFLKIDCEGAEGKIVGTLNEKLSVKIKNISIEYHNHLSLTNNFDLATKLESLGYSIKIKESDDRYGYLYASTP